MRRRAVLYRVFSSLVIAALILIFGSTSGPSHRSAIAGGMAPSVAPSSQSFEGLIAVKEADGVFLVRAENGDKKRFTINPDVKITRNGQPAAYTDLRSRDRVRVYYTTDFVVTEIEASGS
jgi:hypothetical protein